MLKSNFGTVKGDSFASTCKNRAFNPTLYRVETGTRPWLTTIRGTAVFNPCEVRSIVKISPHFPNTVTVLQGLSQRNKYPRQCSGGTRLGQSNNQNHPNFYS